MRVRVKTIYAGPHGSAGPGDEIDLPDEQAQALIDDGNAVSVTPKPETATAPPQEPRKPRRRKSA